MADTDLSAPIEFTLTSAQREQLERLATLRRSDDGLPGPDKTDAHINIKGTVTPDGKLYVSDLSVEFVHRWMDCPGTKP